MLANGKSRLPLIISDTEIGELENWMDAFDEKLEPLQYFILPGGGKAATFYMQQERFAEEQSVLWFS